MSQLRLHFTITPFAFTHLLFGLLSLGKIKDENHALPAAGIEGGYTNNHRQPTATLAHVLLLERLRPADPDRL
ncbi:hypothetical protein D3C77_728070 [compost metagenome]